MSRLDDLLRAEGMGILKDVPGGQADLDRARSMGLVPGSDEPELPDPMSAEGLTLQGSTMSPEQAQAVAAPGPPSDVPTPPGQEAPPSSLPQAIGAENMQQSTKDEMEEQGLGRLHKYVLGAVEPVAQAGQAVKQIRGADTPADAANVRDWKGVTKAGGIPAFAGQMTTMAAPAAKAESALLKATQAASYPARTGIAATVAGTEGGLQPTEEDESRWGNMAQGAALGSAVFSTFYGGRKMLTGMFDTKEAAKRLEKEGIDLTLGQAAETKGFRPAAKVVTAIENTFDYAFPNRGRSVQQVHDRLAKNADLPIEMTDIDNNHRVGSPEYFKTLRDQFDSAYEKLLKPIKADMPDPEQFIDDALESVSVGKDEGIRDLVKADLMQAVKLVRNSPEMSGREIQGVIAKAKEGLKKAMGVGGNSVQEAHTARLYQSVEDEFRKVLEKVAPTSVKKLDQIDQAYAYRQLLELAVEKSGGRTGSVKGLTEALKARSSTGAAVRETGPGAGIIKDAQEVIKPTAHKPELYHLGGAAAAGSVIAGAVKSPLIAGAIAVPPAFLASLGGFSKKGSKALRGMYPKQKMMADAIRKNAEDRAGTAAVMINEGFD